MRNISVDTQGLFSSLALIGFFSIFVALYFAWVPVHQHFVQEQQFATIASTENSLESSLTEKNEESVASQKEGKYMTLDLVTSTVELYDSSSLLSTFTIVHTPVTTSSNMVPKGAYIIDKKTVSEISTIAKMRFPYYITFGDTFALHGTPQGVQGEVVQKEYVGGLIELSQEDAKNIYDFVEVGMPVYVISKTSSQNKTAVGVEDEIVSNELPATSAEAYALRDMSSGKTYLLKNGNERYPIASITKLLTAAVATGVIGHGTEILAPNAEYYMLSELYYPLLLRSDNAVAQKIVEHAGTEFFMSNMNAYARSLGMSRSSFVDSSGLSPKNVSSANDLMLLAQHLYSEKDFIFDITKEEDMTITSREGTTWSVTNQNVLSSDPYFRGGKLGFTDEAGQTSLAVFNVPLRGQVHPIAVVILRSKDWKQDTRTLLRWLVETTKKEN
jgi:hypothetical protein